MSKYRGISAGGEFGDIEGLSAGFAIMDQKVVPQAGISGQRPLSKGESNILKIQGCSGPETCSYLLTENGTKYSLGSPISQRCAECLCMYAFRQMEGANA